MSTQLLQLLCDVDSKLLLPAAAVRAVERVMIDERAVPGIVLMKRAGRALFERVRTLGAQSLCVFCGSGNNAGDGFIVAGLAHLAGLSVQVLQVGDAQKLPADAAHALAWARAAGVSLVSWGSAARGDDDALLRRAAAADVVVDALLGTGFRGALQAPYVDAIAALNRISEERAAQRAHSELAGEARRAPASSRAFTVLAVDLPSGLLADTGAAAEVVVRADETVTFIAVKPGLLTGRGPEFCGRLYLASLAVPEALCATTGRSHASPTGAGGIERVCWSASQVLPRRRRDAHKGDSGHVLVLGGAPGMGGATMLTAEAALRCGAGLVSVGCAAEHVPGLLARRPEVMVQGLAGASAAGRSVADTLAQLLQRATVLAIGPGLGQGEFGRSVLAAALAVARPLVLDADALNLLAGGFADWPPDTIITPHPAEAARILGVSNLDVQRDRLAAAHALCERTGAVVVLKGAGSVICDGHRLRICTDGNPGMAVAGMGDVLTGVIAAQRAQGAGAFEAAVYGVCAHGRAGDMAISDGERGLLASDLFPWLRRLGNGLSGAA